MEHDQAASAHEEPIAQGPVLVKLLICEMLNACVKANEL